MGLTIYSKSKKISREFDGGYIGFARLRQKIWKCLGVEFHSHYETLMTDLMEQNDEWFKKFDEKTNVLITKHNLSVAVVNFLFQPDCGGSIDYKQCKAIYNLIKDDNEPIIFTYSAYSDGKDYDYFKEFLLACYKHKVKMYWF